VGSILFTSWLTLSFKVIERWHINNLQAIVYNYTTCVITGSIVNRQFPINASLIKEPWLPWACLMGLTFISLLNLVAFNSRKVGVAVTSVAFKISLVIPFVFSLYLYHEHADVFKIAGIVLALAAVILTCIPAKKEKDNNIPSNPILWIAPLALFAGSGLLDTMIKYVEQAFINNANQDAYLVTAFGSAAGSGLILLMILFASGRLKFSWKAVWAGIAIGVPNYFSIWCLVRALKGYENNSSAIIPVNNMGIVLLSALVAWLFLHEKLSSANWIGILLSLTAIALIAFG